jgi:signal transduction histidine kinase
MYQIIDNLVGNAIRLSYRDGTIEIRVRVQDNLASFFIAEQAGQDLSVVMELCRESRHNN